MNGRENIIEALEFLKGYGIMRKEENLISTRIGRRFSSFGADIARPAACGFSPPCPDETGHDSAKVSGRFSKKAGVYQIFVLEPEKSRASRDGVVHMEMPFAALKLRNT